MVAALVAFAACGMTGCANDRSADAARIRAAVQTMPGVESSQVDYINDFENGANLDVELDMAHATVAQIRATVASLDDLTGSDFDDHRRTTTITVADFTEVEYGGEGTSLDSTQIAVDVTAVRDLRARGAAARIEWNHFNDHSSLDLLESPRPDVDLRAAIAVLPGSSARLHIDSDAASRQSSWDVALPLTLAQMDDAVAMRDRLPVTVHQMNMRHGQISELSVDLGEPESAAGQLVTIVAVVTPTHDHPLSVDWQLAEGAPRETGRFTTCSPADTNEALALAHPTFALLEEWAARAFPSCSE